ncbi:phosphatidic acid phosphatase [Cellulomonas sp.]|uniref:phosphatidic acid phosphatase n=1 Tax=Cellulomonas sp. TaxID=40001 RepID=UPI001B0F11E5|nr:phosphatidic acid phosphatase [Cellulomonas sp.]MBO9554867.1 phosphatidic acid phosphatase [Cellulomonas sp.]
MTDTLDPPATAQHRLARAVTEVLAPPCLGAATLLLLGWNATGSAGLVDGAVAALFVTGIPYAVVIAGVLAGRWNDRMLTTRRQRIVPILSNIVCALVGLAVARATGAPDEIAAFVVAAIGTQALLFVVNLGWKISFHAGVSAGIALILAAELGPWLALVLAPLVVLICWARVELREHTVAQVAVGAPLGGLALAGLYQVALVSL